MEISKGNRKQASKQANRQTGKQATRQTSSKQASKQATNKRVFIIYTKSLFFVSSPCVHRLGLDFFQLVEKASMQRMREGKREGCAFAIHIRTSERTGEVA